MIRIFSSKQQKIGEIGENQAVIYLKKHGFRIIERNVSNKFGEIDIVARKGTMYHFFEVKTGSMGSINPAESLHKDKIRKFLVSVEHYCLLHRISDYRVAGMLVLVGADGSCAVEIIELF